MNLITRAQAFALMSTRPLRYAVESFLYNRFADTSAIEALRDRFKGKPLLVVGNGPSLNNTPLDAFADSHSIGMNKIDMIFPRTTWRPDLVVCCNNLVIHQHWKTWRELGIPTFLAWKGRHLIPRAGRKSFAFFDATTDHDFSYDPVAGVAIGATVTYVALQLAFYTGADPVVIVGVDHSFAAPNALGTYVKMTTHDSNHFDPNYFPKGSYWGLPDLVVSELNYRAARDAFEGAGRRVLDATVGGKLDIFPKISMDEALSIFASEPPR